MARRSQGATSGSCLPPHGRREFVVQTLLTSTQKHCAMDAGLGLPSRMQRTRVHHSGASLRPSTQRQRPCWSQKLGST